MLQVPEDGLSTVSDVPSINVKLVQIAPASAGLGDAVLDTKVLTVSRRDTSSFVTAPLAQGDYAIRAIDMPYRGYCFRSQTQAFHITAGKFTLLGALNTAAIAAKLRLDADADAAGSRRATTTMAGGHDSFGADAVLDQSPDGLAPPDEASLAAARAYLDTMLQPGSDVEPVVTRPIGRQSDNRNGVDACGIVPHRITNASMAVKSVTPDGLIVGGMFPAAAVNPNRNPGEFLTGLNFVPTEDVPVSYRLPLTDDQVYVDAQCRLTTRAQMLADAKKGATMWVQILTYESADQRRAAPPHIRLFQRFSADVQNCPYVVTGAD
jgi:hypothetical protein